MATYSVEMWAMVADIVSVPYNRAQERVGLGKSAVDTARE